MNADLAVRDVMSHEFVGVSEADDVRGTARLMLEEDVDCAVVLRGRQPVGVVTERDVLRLVERGEDPETTTVGDLMGEAGPTLSPGDGITRAMDLLTGGDARRLLVADGEGVEGILTGHDLLSAAALDRHEEPSHDRIAPDGVEEYAAAGDRPDRAVSDQSICQACGALAGDLAPVDGQLLCPDCADV
jgi:CBS domain-containing protein